MSQLDALRLKIRCYFTSAEDMEEFLTSPHSCFGDKTPAKWYKESRQKDKEAYFLDTLRQLKDYVAFLEEC